jgi:hypothetical protein
LLAVIRVYHSINNLPTVIVDESSEIGALVYFQLAVTLGEGNVIEDIAHFVEFGQRVTIWGATNGGLRRKVLHEVFAGTDLHVFAWKFTAMGGHRGVHDVHFKLQNINYSATELALVLTKRHDWIDLGCAQRGNESGGNGH